MKSAVIPVLDKGYVELKSTYGTDQSIVDIARISHGVLEGSDRPFQPLIKTLVMKEHFSCFEMAIMDFQIKTPIFVARQWMRHRVGSYLEKSLRYTRVEEPEFYVPDECQDTSKELILASFHHSYETYQALLKKGIRKEEARIVLPLATYTVFHWSVNLRSLMNFLSLRAKREAQFETRMYAFTVGYLMKMAFPATFEAFSQFAYSKSPEVCADFIDNVETVNAAHILLSRETRATD